MSTNILPIIRTAADLLSDTVDENPEYDRAIVELTANLLGLGREEMRPWVAAILETEKCRT